MPDKRKAYAPFSLITESGVSNAPVEGYIDVNQEIQPIVSTGTVNENGTWVGVKSSDSEFINFQKDVAIANGGEVISNNSISTYGYSKINLALQVSRTGDYFFETITAGDVDERYFNLYPISTAASLKSTIRTDSGTNVFSSIVSDQETIGYADVWLIYQINDIGNFKFKFKITNQSGGASDIQLAIQRLV